MAKHATLQAERRETARRKLSEYRVQCDIFERLLRIIESAESRLTSITAQQSELIKTSGAKDRLADQIITLNAHIDRLHELNEGHIAYLDDALYLINSLLPEHTLEARVLSKRYLEPNYEPTFAEIAEEMGFSEDWVKHKHLRGLDFVANVIFEN